MPHLDRPSPADDLTFTGFSLAASAIIFTAVHCLTSGPTGYAPRFLSGVLLGIATCLFMTEIASCVVQRRRDRQ